MLRAWLVIGFFVTVVTLSCSSDNNSTGGGGGGTDLKPLNLTNVIWTGSRYLAVGGSSLLSSTDGLSWNETVLDADSLRGLAVTDSVVLFIGDSAAVYTSATGSGFQRTVLDLPYPIRGIAKGTNGWVAISEAAADSGVVMVCEAFSTNRADWSVQITSGVTFSQIIWDGAQYVAVGSWAGVGVVGQSANGGSWGLSQITGVSDVYALELRDGVYCALGHGSGGPNRRIVSTDGQIWNSLPFVLTKAVNGLTHSNAQWLMIDADGGVWNSTGGSSWDRTVLSAGHQFRDVVWRSNQFVVVGDSALWVSADGYTWESRLPRQAIFQP